MKSTRLKIQILGLFFSFAAEGFGNAALALPPADDNGIVHMKAFDLPVSSLLAPDSRAALAVWHKENKDLQSSYAKCGDIERPSPEPSPEEATAIRRCQSEVIHQTAVWHTLQQMYPVTIAAQRIDGVNTEIFLPREGIDPKNAHRVLINLHGGGFVNGWDWETHYEAAPVSTLGRIKVIGVDYRMAPEFKFPAATDDVVAVYKEILQSYKPGEIGLYGCSAGGLLTAEVTARIVKEKLPRPGAVGMLCAGAVHFLEGDSGQLTIDGKPEEFQNDPYFKQTDRRDPQAFPVFSREIMAQFPPSLLIGSTRDGALSAVAKTHSTLVSLGVPAELHIWEGVEHGFLIIPDLPEAKEAVRVIVDFFDAHLQK